MAYRLKLKEPVGRAVRRIGAEQLERALRELRGRDAVTAIHQTRKCIKRLRALLRLVRPGIDKSDYRRINAGLRDAGRALSAVRDRDVMAQTVVGLADGPGEHKPALRRLAKALAGQSADGTAPSIGAARAEARALLQEAADNWQKLKPRPDSFATIAAGLERGLTELANAHAATAADDDEAFHDLRKAVQRHWRHMRLVEAGWPGYFGARAEEASTISDLLGRAQDFTLLIDHLDGPSRNGLSQPDALAVRETARQQRKALRKEARGLIARLIAEGPGAHARRATDYWEAAASLVSKAKPSPQAQTAIATVTRQPRMRSPQPKTAKARRGAS